MPLNLLKNYNQLLELAHYNEFQRKNCLQLIFNRDIANNVNFSFLGKPIHPTPIDGQIPMQTLFSHLTTTMVEDRHRIYDPHRSCRLHWIKYHIDEMKDNNMLTFTCNDNGSVRTYIYDEDENYVIVLEPKNNNTTYFFITAYVLMGKDRMRDKIKKKYNRRLPEIL